MFSNLKVYKCGDFYKIVSINLKSDSKVNATLHKIENDKKLRNNLVRCKTNIQNYALCNNFSFFVTITFKPEYDRFNLDVLRKNFYYSVKIMRSVITNDIKYLVVPEQHKNGAWHFHCFFSGISDVCYVNEHGFLDCDYLNRLGHVNIQLVRDICKCSSYVTKYIIKNLGDGVKKWKNSYFISRNLDKPVLVEDFIYNNTRFDIEYFDYKTDYCRLKTIKKDDYKKFSTILSKTIE